MKFFIFSFLPFLLFAQTPLNKTSFQNGKKLYTQTCISCHGKNGETNPNMMLIIKPRKLNSTILTQEQSFKIIKEGAHYWGAHSDIMPAFKYVYKDTQIKDIAYYIAKEFNPNRKNRVNKLMQESKSSNKSEKESLEIGAKIFKKHCSLCHGATGNGESEYVEKSKKDDKFIYPYNLRRTLLNENQIFLYAKFGGHYWGTDKNDMPSWKKKYKDKKLKSVAKYVYQNIKQIKE